MPKPGDVIADRYRVERVIGAGGMGAVVAAKHIALGDDVALKFLHPQLLEDASFIARFVREARVTARIKDEHVVRVFDVGTTAQNIPFLAMELLDGEDLGSIAARGPMPVELAVDCFLQACLGLLRAHKAGVVHRDVKPSNLWLTRKADGAPLVKVLDFGISKGADGTEGDHRLTDTQSVFGSPSYMSPEQVRSARNVDARTDVWALGVVLFELLTGGLPFRGETAPALLAAIVVDPPVPLRKVRADAPAELEEAIIGLLQKTPGERASIEDTARRVRPFASPVGQAAADLITRSQMMAASTVPVSSALRISSPTAMGDTLPQLVTSTTQAPVRKSGRGWLFVGAGVVVAGAIGLLAIVRHGASAEAPAESPASAARSVAPAEPIAPAAPPAKTTEPMETTSEVPAESSTKPATPTAPTHGAPPRASAAKHPPSPAPSATPTPSETAAPTPSPAPSPSKPPNMSPERQ